MNRKTKTTNAPNSEIKRMGERMERNRAVMQSTYRGTVPVSWYVKLDAHSSTVGTDRVRYLILIHHDRAESSL